MSEFDRPNNENGHNDADDIARMQNEIARIQNEIDKALNPTLPEHVAGASESGRETADTGVAYTGDPTPAGAALTPADPDTGAAYTGDPTPAGAVVTPAGPSSPSQPNFYQETIKEPRKEKKVFKRVVALITAMCILGGTAGGFFLGLNASFIKKRVTSMAPAQEASPTVVETANAAAESGEESTFTFNDSSTQKQSDDFDLRAMSNRFVDIVKEVEPAVVAVTLTTASRSTFYGIINEEEAGAGSGIIFSEDDEKAFIVTNHHVVSGDSNGYANSVYVSISDSDTVPARLVGSDAQADLAVISISKSDLKNVGIEKVSVAHFGDSDDLQVGEVVLAIGNALGEGNSTSMGLIGTKEKEMSINSQEAPLTLIQTSASINFGNSGGPLINLDGEVVGINTAKANPMVGAEGLGYSIPSNIAKPIIESLMNRANTPFLGISGQSMTAEFAAMYGLPEAGVLIVTVFEGSSAERAGVKRTDIITAFNGEAVFTIEQLTEKIKACKVGDTVEIRLIREGKTPMSVEATLDKYSDTEF